MQKYVKMFRTRFFGRYLDVSSLRGVYQNGVKGRTKKMLKNIIRRHNHLRSCSSIIAKPSEVSIVLFNISTAVSSSK